jgi:hypothetical protein
MARTAASAATASAAFFDVSVAPGGLACDRSGGEDARVGRALALDVVADDPQPQVRGSLLQRRLVVDAGAQRHSVREHPVDEPVHQRERLLTAPAHVAGADERLDGVRQDRVLVTTARRILALAQQQVRAHVVVPRDAGQRARVHDRRAHLRQTALRQLRVVLEEGLRRDELQHGVAQELQPLVRGDAPVLERERPVREGKTKRRGVDVDPETLREAREVLVSHIRCQTSAILRPLYSRNSGVPAESSTTLAWWGREYTTRPFSTVLTSAGAWAFHAERRWRVLLRDSFRLGTAMISSPSSRSEHS